MPASYDAFSDPTLQQSLAELDPSQGKLQFDPRALMELVRRRAAATLTARALNRSSMFHKSGGIYDVTENGNVQNYMRPDISIDPLNAGDRNDLLELEDATEMRPSGMSAVSPQPYGGGDSDEDRLLYRGVPSFTPPPSPMALRASGR